jgi:hypothetical protein
MAKLQRLAAALPYWRKLRRIFDAQFYLRKYPDVAAAGGDPFRHYLEYGASEGRKPHPLFDHDYYALYCPEARQGSEPSIFHFLKSPVPKGNPHPLFDCESYLRSHPDAARRRVNPLLHYRSLTVAAQNGRLPPQPLAEPRPLGSGRAALIEIMDVCVTILFEEGDGGIRGNVVRVWQDASGRMQFIAPPEQQPFFAAMKYDQLRAQTQESAAK